MQEQLDSVELDVDSLDKLYPFHLIVHDESGPVIRHVGPQIDLPGLDTSKRVELLDHFDLVRPRLNLVNFEQLAASQDKLVILAAKLSQLALRGQLVLTRPHELLFVCTLSVNNSESVAEAGVSLNAFAPHDLAPDLLILQRIKEMQLKELSRQNDALAAAIRERDQFDHYANTDAMTQLWNRRGFLFKGREILQATPTPGAHWLLHIDVSNFKYINDTYGHFAGDAVLCEVAKRLTSRFDDNGIIGRWGGDEFVVLTSDPSVAESSGGTVDAINRLRQPVNHNDKSIKLGLSCGIISSSFSLQLEKLIHYADLTMYEGRKNGRDRDEFFRGELQEKIEFRERITQLLEAAMQAVEFEPYFQPIIDLQTGQLRSFEALARWTSRELGVVSPADFIAVAESMNLLVEFDRMMLKLVARQLSEWSADYPDLAVHVNFSAPSFTPDLPTQLEQILQSFALPNSSLIVELTETSLLLDSAKTRDIIEALVNRGFAVELDDFGTGYSSLTHLKDFAVTGVKVDTTFVHEASNNARSLSLLHGIVTLSQTLGLHCVAEGVETAEQLELLQALDCDSAQGYLFSRPLPAEQCRALLQDSYPVSAQIHRLAS